MGGRDDTIHVGGRDTDSSKSDQSSYNEEGQDEIAVESNDTIRVGDRNNDSGEPDPSNDNKDVQNEIAVEGSNTIHMSGKDNDNGDHGRSNDNEEGQEEDAVKGNDTVRVGGRNNENGEPDQSNDKKEVQDEYAVEGNVEVRDSDSDYDSYGNRKSDDESLFGKDPGAKQYGQRGDSWDSDGNSIDEDIALELDILGQEIEMEDQFDSDEIPDEVFDEVEIPSEEDDGAVFHESVVKRAVDVEIDKSFMEGFTYENGRMAWGV
jgi:hypothetical protein